MWPRVQLAQETAVNWKIQTWFGHESLRKHQEAKATEMP